MVDHPFPLPHSLPQKLLGRGVSSPTGSPVFMSELYSMGPLLLSRLNFPEEGPIRILPCKGKQTVSLPSKAASFPSEARDLLWGRDNQPSKDAALLRCRWHSLCISGIAHWHWLLDFGVPFLAPFWVGAPPKDGAKVRLPRKRFYACGFP